MKDDSLQSFLLIVVIVDKRQEANASAHLPFTNWRICSVSFVCWACRYPAMMSRSLKLSIALGRTVETVSIQRCYNGLAVAVVERKTHHVVQTRLQVGRLILMYESSSLA
jgi:hypothetical protein